MTFVWVLISFVFLSITLAICLASPALIVQFVEVIGRGPRFTRLLLHLHHHPAVPIVFSMLVPYLGMGVTRAFAKSRIIPKLVYKMRRLVMPVAGWIEQGDRTKKTRLVALLATLTPLVIFCRWFAVVHGTFAYDDLDILAVIRTTPFVTSLLLLHGDAAIPLFRVFFAGMYAIFGVQDVYWNLYSLLLTMAVNTAALVLLVRLGTNLVVSALFYVTAISSAVWTSVAFGYYSMSIYLQIGLLGILGALAVVKWQDEKASYSLLAAVVFSALAPFIHPSGAYVPAAVGGFAFVRELGRPGATWSPLRMLRPDYRWFTLGLALVVLLFSIFLTAAVKFHGGTFLSMAHNPLSPAAVAYSIYFLLSQGLVLELLKPFSWALSHGVDVATQGAIGLAATCGLIIAGVAKLRTEQRWTFLALLVPSLAIVIIVSFGRRLVSIEDVTYTGGKYNNFAFLWFLMAISYLAGCLVERIPGRWRVSTAAVAIAITAATFVGYAIQNHWWKTGPIRKQQQSLISVFERYAERTAPAPMNIPTLDGAYIWPRYNLLFTYNLSHYRPFFGPFDERMNLLRNQAMDPWGREMTQTVSSLRRATDPAFIEALKTDKDLQSLYLGGVELRQKDLQPGKRDAIRLEAANVAGASASSTDDGTLTIATEGGASIRLSAGDWDPETSHILTFRVMASPATPQLGGESIEVAFAGDLPIPYASNKLLLPKGGGVVSIDLLQLYSYALNPRVRDLSLRFPRAGSYTISDVSLSR
jgi:hypothetical protein